MNVTIFLNETVASGWGSRSSTTSCGFLSFVKRPILASSAVTIISAVCQRVPHEVCVSNATPGVQNPQATKTNMITHTCTTLSPFFGIGEHKSSVV